MNKRLTAEYVHARCCFLYVVDEEQRGNSNWKVVFVANDIFGLHFLAWVRGSETPLAVYTLQTFETHASNVYV